MRRILLSFILLNSVVMAFAGQTATQLAAQLNHLQTFQAMFTQTMQQGQRHIKQTGTVAIQKPGKFRWQVMTPHPQLYVSNGQKIWHFDQALRQVTIQKLNHGLSDTPIMLLTGSVPLSKLYHIDTTAKDQFVLTPKQPGSVMKAITLRFKNNQLTSMSLQNNLNQTTQIQFSQIRYNHKIAPAIFTFTAPKGADVLNLT